MLQREVCIRPRSVYTTIRQKPLAEIGRVASTQRKDLPNSKRKELTSAREKGRKADPRNPKPGLSRLPRDRRVLRKVKEEEKKRKAEADPQVKEIGAKLQRLSR